MKQLTIRIIWAIPVVAITVWVGGAIVSDWNERTGRPPSLKKGEDPFVNRSLFESEEFLQVDAHRESKFWDSTSVRPEFLQAECGVCHRTIHVPGAPLLTEGRSLIKDKGCVGCHDVGDVFAVSERGPNLDDIGLKTTRGWLYNWIRDPQSYLPQPNMPSFRLSDDEIFCLIDFLSSIKNLSSPPRPVMVDPLENGDEDRGNVLVRESRCITCHSIHERGGDFAPELELVGDKVRPMWLANFLRNVHYYQPEKKMLEFNFTEQDALDITAYIFEEFSDEGYEFPEESESYQALLDSLPLDERIKAGAEIFENRGCRGCHTITGIPKRKIAPDLSAIGDRHKESISFGMVDDAAKNLANWIFMKVSDPDIFSDAMNMPDFHLTKREALAITLALLSNKPSAYPEGWFVHEAEPNRYVSPDEDFAALLDKFSCLSCHRIKGFGGDISTAPLTFEGSKVRYNWLKNYLVRPHAVRPTLTERMPLFRMTEGEATIMANYVKTVFTTDDIPNMQDNEFTAQEATAGKEIFERERCISCHIVEKEGGYVGPQLEDVGSRLEPGWIYAWVKNPLKFRPHTSQPDYGFSDAEARAVTAFLLTKQSNAANLEKE